MCFSPKSRATQKLILIKSNPAILKICSQLTAKTPKVFVGINFKYSWLAQRYSILYSTELYPMAQKMAGAGSA